MRTRRFGLCLVALALAVGTVAATASANRFTPGSDGLGDPFFPLAGNGGYDVQKYTLKLDYDPATDRLVGTATIVAEATQGLKSFNLDLREFITVTSIKTGTKQGFKMEAAEWSRSGQELTVFPRERTRERTQFSVVVEYEGVVEPITDPDDSIEGFVPTDDGAYVVNEPGLARLVSGQRQPERQGALRHLDHRPRGADGARQRPPRLDVDGERQDDLELEPVGADGAIPRHRDERPLRPDGHDALPTGRRTTSRSTRRSRRAAAVLANIPAIQAYFSSIYGPYPPDAIGAIVDRAGSSATRSRRSRRPTTRGCRARTRSRTRSRTSGSATRSR